MATYRGNELPKPDQIDKDLKLAGRRLSGLENTEEDLGLPEEAGPDYVPRPGQKHYMETKPMAAYHRGGMVKKGSYTQPQMCGGSKIIKTWQR